MGWTVEFQDGYGVVYQATVGFWSASCWRGRNGTWRWIVRGMGPLDGRIAGHGYAGGPVQAQVLAGEAMQSVADCRLD